MPLYENGLDSNYEEIKGYYPQWYPDILEMNAVWQALGGQLDGVQGGIESVVNNNYIYLADEATIKQYEVFLGIPYNAERPLEERRKLAASFFVGSGHFGAPEIKAVVATFTPSPCTVTFIDSRVGVTVTRDIEDTFLLTDCYFILLKKIPAHLGLGITVVSPFNSGLYLGTVMNQYKEEVIIA